MFKQILLYDTYFQFNMAWRSHGRTNSELIQNLKSKKKKGFYLYDECRY